jgi:putative aldouronate transport system permease protein
VSVGYWNDWFWPMMLLKQTDLFTLQLVLRSIIVDATSDISITSGAASASVFSEGVKMAAVVATMLPIMLIYPFLQKYFVKGMLVGAVKM